MFYEALIFFFLGTFIPFCSNRRKRSKSVPILEQKFIKESNISINNIKPKSCKKASNGLKNSTNLKTLINNPLKGSARMDETHERKQDIKNKVLKEVNSLKHPKPKSIDNNNNKKTENIEVNKISKKVATTKDGKCNTNKFQNIIIKNKNSEEEQIKTSVKPIGESKNTKNGGLAKNEEKSLLINDTQYDEEVNKPFDAETEKDYQENKKKVLVSFNPDNIIKDGKNVLPVGQFNLHIGLDVWACDSISK
uniref:Uncharacterized protein n=1 Tax=Strongyloides venezuelensis TaxID=75913 RepID=A0A0K0F092_STRVS